MDSLSQSNHCGPIDEDWIKELKTSLKASIVVTPGSEGYSKSVKRWSSTCDKRPGIVVYVTSAEDVSATILFSRAHSMDVAVHGGGHSSNGSSSTNGGLVIDLRKMRKVTVEPEKQTVLAQGGTIWADIDTATAEFGLAVVGGTVNHTGVGGLTLGGGYGWLTGRHGLTIDSLLEVTIVLADGSIKKASAYENSDLFWAVRGAGQSFGVVVEFMFQAHEQKNAVWAGSLYFPAKSKLEAVVEFANHLVEVTDGNSAMGIVLNWPPFMSELTAVAVVFHNGSKEEATKLFAPLLDLNPDKDTTAERPYSEVNSLLNKGTEHGKRRTAKGACYVTPLCPTFVRSLVEELAQLYQEIPDATASAIVFEFYGTKQSSEIAPTATAFANRGQHQNAMASPGWTDPANDKGCYSWAGKVAQRFADELERVKKERGKPASMDRITEYGNYDGLSSADPKRIFGVNYRRVNQLKGVYDPDNVFNKPYAGLRKDLYLPWDPEEA